MQIPIALSEPEYCKGSDRVPRIIGGMLAVVFVTALAGTIVCPPAAAQEKRPNIVMLMTDDTGWNDFGAYSGGGVALGHPTPSVDRIAKEGATFTELVRSGELHCGPRLVHHRAHSDPLGAVHRRRSRRQELSPQGDADHRRVLPEERLLDLFLGQVASRRQARLLSDRARLRRDEAFRRLLCRRLRLQRHLEVVPPVVPVVQPGVHQERTTRS